MSDTVPSNVSGPNSDTRSKKKRKNKKKGATNKDVASTDQKDVVAAENTKQEEPVTELHDPASANVSDDESDQEEHDASNGLTRHTETEPETGTSAGTSVDEQGIAAVVNGVSKTAMVDGDNNADDNTSLDDATARFDALVKDRDALRAEVTQLRQSLEQLQAKHGEEMEAVQTELQETQGEKETAEEQYQNLLVKVNTIRGQLGERLKAGNTELASARTRIEELEEQNVELQEQHARRSTEVEGLSSRAAQQERELIDLRNRSTLSQQNWIKERDELIESEAYIREEFENAKIAMHDWEVLATEERQVRRDLELRVGDLEEQLSNLRAEYENVVDERDTQAGTVDGLQRALSEIQDARRRELREVVENSTSEMQTLRKQIEELQNENEKSKTELEGTKKELERTAPFEKEVKEKNLLIGKLRHEAVILNDHLTKALRFLKKGKPEDNVDRQIVTNHLLHFLALDRSDPRKFQILQLIASLLNWTDEQKEQAGLTRPGGSSSMLGTGSLRLLSPNVHRTPSTPALMSGDYFGNSGESAVTSPSGSVSGRESLAELWQSFLEQEANSSATTTGGTGRRRESAASAATQSTSRG